MRTWDDTVELVKTIGYEEDELGQQKPIESRIEICCCKEPVSRNEFYLAGQSGIKVSEIVIVHPYEYSGEKYVISDGKRLAVVKTYKISMEELELTCTEKIGDRCG